MILEIDDQWADELCLMAQEASEHARPWRAQCGVELQQAIRRTLYRQLVKQFGALYVPYGVPGGFSIGQLHWDDQLGPVMRVFRIRRSNGQEGPDIYQDSTLCQADCDRLNKGPWAIAQG